MSEAEAVRRMLDPARWQALDDADVAWWQSRTPAERVAAAELVRESTRAIRPDWPTAEAFEADLATHVRVGELLRRADRHQ